MVDTSNRIYCDDNSVPANSEMVKWAAMVAESTKNSGRSGQSAESYKSQLEAAGFVDVVQVVYKWPTNTWPRDLHHKTLGLWSHASISEQIHGLSVALFTRYLGMSLAELEVFLVGARKELDDTKLHGYFPL